MLSYRWGPKVDGVFPTQERVKQIQSELEGMNHRTWLDLDYMRGEMETVMISVVEDCAVFLACLTNDYFDDGSNAQLEFAHALSHRQPGIDMLFVKLEHDFDCRRLDKYDACRGVRVYDLSSSGPVDQLAQELKTMVASCPALRSARRRYRQNANGGGTEEVYVSTFGATLARRRSAFEIKVGYGIHMSGRPSTLSEQPQQHYDSVAIPGGALPNPDHVSEALSAQYEAHSPGQQAGYLAIDSEFNDRVPPVAPLQARPRLASVYEGFDTGAQTDA